MLGRQIAFFAVALLAATAARAQSEALETIEVVGSRISYHDLLDAPAVSLTRPGDYLLLPITLTNDTRSEDGRKKEIYATIDRMVAAAGKRFTIVQSGEYPVEVTAGNAKVALDKEAKRQDTTTASLSVRASIGGDAKHAEELIASMREFVARVERVGRTEIDAGKETAVSLTRPFRYELIEAIAADTERVRAQLGASCKVNLEGLNSRIEWRRVSASELLLYIPYRMAVEGCGA
jgi:hypothetical protein